MYGSMAESMASSAAVQRASTRRLALRLQVTTLPLPGATALARIKEARKEGRSGEAVINGYMNNLALGFAVVGVRGGGTQGEGSGREGGVGLGEGSLGREMGWREGTDGDGCLLRDVFS